MKNRVSFYSVIVLIFFFIVFSISLVSGFGISTIYSENYPLKIKAGQAKETFFLVSNTAPGDSDFFIRPELVQGFEITSLIEGAKNYNVPFGEEVEVPVKIEIPGDAEVGAVYKVGAMFRPSPSLVEAGNVQFLVNIGKSFPVIVVENPEEIEKQISQERGFQLTIEDGPEDVVGEFAPPQPVKGRIGIWLGIIFVLAVGIMIAIVLIIYLVLKSRRMERELTIGRGFVQPSNTYGDGYSIE